MKIEWLLFAVVLIAALIPIFRGKGRSWRFTGLILLGSVVVTIAAAAALQKQLTRRSQLREQVMKTLPREGRPGGFVSSDSCQACHPREYHTWHRSYHRTMTQYAAPESVKAKFDNVTLEYHGEKYRLEKRRDEFWADMPDMDWKHAQMARGRLVPAGETPRVSKRIGMLTGSHHMQAFWYSGPSGNIQIGFPFVYLLADQKWVPRNDSFLMDPALPAPVQIWNNNCVQCHTTAGQPRPQRANKTVMDTHVAEIGISCEACHGPANAHIAENRNPLDRFRFHHSAGVDKKIINPARLDHRRSSQVCGQCHGVKWIPAQERWQEEGFSFRPGADLDQSTPILRPVKHAEELFVKETLKRDPTFLSDRFWSDGMVRVSGREFNGLTESPCFQRGTLSCVSCHSMHDSAPDDQLARHKESNAACVECHKSIRVAEHTHHAANSSGSLCYNCHMPHTTYGLLKAIRSHQIDSPSVETSSKTGRPNACNLCHLDKTLEWTSAHLTKWYGAKPVELSAEDKAHSAAALLALKGDAGQRALIAWHMGWKPAQEISGRKWLAPYLGQLLEDPYGTVRYVALRSLKSLPEFRRFEFDYISGPDERRRAHEDTLKIWRDIKDLDRTAAEVFVDFEGTRNEWVKLLEQRNNRSMYLQE
ncbi:MAG TPA: cytochrome c3 family protein [Candidatus Binatia bacterium]|nr:cytochrome c3 family protein [Candidatus Binatia bacterium]